VRIARCLGFAFFLVCLPPATVTQILERLRSAVGQIVKPAGGKQPVLLCPLAAQAVPKPKDMSRYHPQESFFRRIMLVPQTLIPLPVHSLGL
jgi:hypothetical protein